MLALAFAAFCLHAQSPTPASAIRGPVLVELFTSEGCPHCPEADAMLEKLYSEQSIDGAEIIALEEHVDYWDRPAWMDHYSSSIFTDRQKSYAEAMDLESLYTPQMVVDGLVEFVGNNAPRARSTISALSRAPLPPVRLSPPVPPLSSAKAPGALLVRLDARDLAHESPAEIYLVLAEDKLFSRVNGGSNAGESWPHSSIAHWFRLAGKMAPGTKDFSLIAQIEPPQAAWRVENLRLIALVQEQETRRILALGSARLADVLPQLAVPKAAANSSNRLLEAGGTRD